MINSLDIQKSNQKRPPRIVLYGVPKIGKSTFASQAPAPLFLDIEDGLDALDVDRVKGKNYHEALGVVDALLNEPHEYKTLVVDSIDWFETLVHKQVAYNEGKNSIEDIGYGKGYSMALPLMQSFLDHLTTLRNQKNMAIIVIGHSHIKRYDNPTTDSYDRHTLKMHQKTADLVTEWADCLLFANDKVFTTKEEIGFNKDKTRATSATRVLYTAPRPAFVAGNRYGLPEELPFTWQSFIEAFNQAVNK